MALTIRSESALRLTMIDALAIVDFGQAAIELCQEHQTLKNPLLGRAAMPGVVHR